MILRSIKEISDKFLSPYPLRGGVGTKNPSRAYTQHRFQSFDASRGEQLTSGDAESWNKPAKPSSTTRTPSLSTKPGRKMESLSEILLIQYTLGWRG